MFSEGKVNTWQPTKRENWDFVSCRRPDSSTKIFETSISFGWDTWMSFCPIWSNGNLLVIRPTSHCRCGFVAQIYMGLSSKWRARTSRRRLGPRVSSPWRRKTLSRSWPKIIRSVLYTSLTQIYWPEKHLFFDETNFDALEKIAFIQ